MKGWRWSVRLAVALWSGVAVAGPDVGPEVELGPDAYARAPGFQSGARVAVREDGFLVAWNRSGSMSGDWGGVYVARVDANGALLDRRERLVSTALSNAGSIDGLDGPALSRNDRGYLLVYSGTLAEGGQARLYAAVLGNEGEVIARDLPVAPTGRARLLNASWDGARHLVVWQMDQAFQIYGMRIASDGALLDPAPFLISGPSSAAELPQVTWNGTHHLVTWRESPGLFGRRISGPDGTFADAAPVMLLRGGSEAGLAACALAGGDVALAWLDEAPSSTNQFRIVGTVVGPDVTAAPAFTFSDTPGPYWFPALACSGSKARAMWPRFTSDGTQVWHLWTAGRDFAAGAPAAPPPAQLTSAAEGELGPALACSGTRCMAAWTARGFGDVTMSGRELRGTAVDLAGARAGGGDQLLSSDAAAQGEPRACWDGARYFAVWTETHDGGLTTRADVHGAWLDARGVPSGGQRQIAAAAGMYPRAHTRAVACAGGAALVSWLEDAQEGALDVGTLHVRRVSADGTAGVPLLLEATAGLHAAAGASDGRAFLLAWVDDAARVALARVPLDWDGAGVARTVGATVVGFAGLVALWNGQSYLVAWSTGDRLAGVRVGSDGAVLDASAPLTLATGRFDGLELAAAAGPSVSAIVGVNTPRPDAGVPVPAVEGVILDQQARPIGTFRVPTTAADAPFTNLGIAWNGQGFVVSWEAPANYGPSSSPSPGIRAVRLSQLGEVLDPSPAHVADGAGVTNPAAAGDGAGHSLIAYARTDTQTAAFQPRIVARLVAVGAVDGGALDAGGPADAGAADAGAGGDALDRADAGAQSGGDAANDATDAGIDRRAGSGAGSGSGCSCAAGARPEAAGRAGVPIAVLTMVWIGRRRGRRRRG